MIISSHLTPLLAPSSHDGQASAGNKVNTSHFKRFMLFVVNCFNTAKKTAASFLAPCRPFSASDTRKMRGAKLRVGHAENKEYAKHFIRSRADAIEESKAWCMSEIAKIDIPIDFIDRSSGDDWNVVGDTKDLEKIGNCMTDIAADIFSKLKKDYFEHFVNFEEVTSSRIRALVAHYSVPRPSFNNAISDQPHEREFKRLMLSAYDRISDVLIRRLAGSAPGEQDPHVSEYSLKQRYLRAFRETRVEIFRTFSNIELSSKRGLTQVASKELIQAYDAAFQEELKRLDIDSCYGDTFLNKLVRAHQAAKLPQDFFKCSPDDAERLNESFQAAAPPPLLLAKMAIRTIGALQVASNIHQDSIGLSTSA
jgi:hypothetical protein